MTGDRFVDDDRWLGSFLDQVLVYCPQCTSTGRPEMAVGDGDVVS